MTQLLLALFGLASAYMAMGTRSERARRWAPFVGLAGQPCWLAFAWSLPEDKRWALVVISSAFTVVYLRGCLLQLHRKDPEAAR